jgi:(1->4)-alpha-D-glucan 1-alpha-D-glucosylmutase
VDPDNRAPVDFDAATGVWDTLRPRLSNPDPASVRDLLADAPDGRIKVLVTAAALHHRLGLRDLYALGDYVPLRFEGEAEDLFAYARTHGRDMSITLVARPTGKAGGEARVSDRTTLVLPADTPGRWRDVLTGRELRSAPLHAAEALELLPCALLVPA